MMRKYPKPGTVVKLKPASHLRLLALGLTWVMGGCFGIAQKSTSPSQGPIAGNGTVAAYFTDTPADGILSFQIVVSGATLTDATNHSSVLSGSVQTIEARHLDLAPAIVFETNSVANGNYTALNLTLANPQITVADAQGNVTQISASSTPSVRLMRSAIPVPLAVTVPDGGIIGILIDLDLQQSVSVDPSGNYVVNPVIRPSVVNLSNGNSVLVDAIGTIAAIPSSPANTFDFQPAASGLTLRISADSNTHFSNDINQFSNLRVAQAVELTAQLRSDGSYLATEIHSGAPDPNLRFQGVVARIRQDSSGNFVLDVVVQK